MNILNMVRRHATTLGLTFSVVLFIVSLSGPISTTPLNLQLHRYITGGLFLIAVVCMCLHMGHSQRASQQEKLYRLLDQAVCGLMPSEFGTVDGDQITIKGETKGEIQYVFVSMISFGDPEELVFFVTKETTNIFKRTLEKLVVRTLPDGSFDDPEMLYDMTTHASDKKGAIRQLVQALESSHHV